MSHKKLIAFIILINHFSQKVFGIDADFNAVPKTYNVSTVLSKRVRAHTNYKLTWIDFTDGRTGAQLVVALPPQLRLIQTKHDWNQTRIKTEVVDNKASIRLRDPNLIHQGFYSAFKVVNDSLSGLFVEERRDFYIEITDLGKHGDICREDADCRSNYCHNNTCVCDSDSPVAVAFEKDVSSYNNDNSVTVNHRLLPIKFKCLKGPPIGGKCLTDSQCQWIGGPDAECSSKHKCRCINNMFVINLPYHGKFCVPPRTLNDRCMYSEQCLAVGHNRYCDQELKCRCLPDHRYKPGIGCVHSINGTSRTAVVTTNLWPLLAIAFTVAYHRQLVP